MPFRRRIKHTATLSERLAAEAERLRERAKKMPRGAQREELLRKAPDGYRIPYERVAIILSSAIAEAARRPQQRADSPMYLWGWGHERYGSAA
jgi:hypothetical protein